MEQSMGVGRTIGHGLDANLWLKMEQKKRGPLGSTDARRTSQVGKGVERGESTPIAGRRRSVPMGRTASGAVRARPPTGDAPRVRLFARTRKVAALGCVHQ